MAAEFRFGRLTPFQKRYRVKYRLSPQANVQKIGLVGLPPRRGFVNRRNSLNRHKIANGNNSLL
jgi:hypothetical protein